MRIHEAYTKQQATRDCALAKIASRIGSGRRIGDRAGWDSSAREAYAEAIMDAAFDVVATKTKEIAMLGILGAELDSVMREELNGASNSLEMSDWERAAVLSRLQLQLLKMDTEVEHFGLTEPEREILSRLPSNESSAAAEKLKSARGIADDRWVQRRQESKWTKRWHDPDAEFAPSSLENAAFEYGEIRIDALIDVVSRSQNCRLGIIAGPQLRRQAAVLTEIGLLKIRDYFLGGYFGRPEHLRRCWFLEKLEAKVSLVQVSLAGGEAFSSAVEPAGHANVQYDPARERQPASRIGTRRRGRPRKTIDQHPEVQDYVDQANSHIAHKRLLVAKVTLRDFCIVSGHADDTELGNWRRGSDRAKASHERDFRRTLALSIPAFIEAVSKSRKNNP